MDEEPRFGVVRRKVLHEGRSPSGAPLHRLCELGRGLAVSTLLLGSPAAAANLGVAGSEVEGDIFVFDPLEREIVEVLDVGSGFVGDCVVDPDSRRAFVGKGSGVWIIDLLADPPALAPGTNPIPVADAGDLSMTADGAFVAACGTTDAFSCGSGNASDVVTVIDAASGGVVDAMALGESCCAVDVCSDGSVLVALPEPGMGSGVLRRLTVDGTGQLTDTAEALPFQEYPFNLSCAPDGGTAVVSLEDGSFLSVAVDGLALLDTLDFFLSGAGVDHQGDRVYFRRAGSVRAWGFDPVTGAFGSLEVEMGTLPEAFIPRPGLDSFAISSPLRQAFSSGGQNIRINDTETGTQLTGIFVPSFHGFTGLCLGDTERIQVDGFETGDLSAWSSSFPE